MSNAGRYRMIEGKLVKISDRPRLPAHYHGEDRMDPLVNPADGKIYDSRSTYYNAVKAAGCHIVGDDAKTETSKDIQGDFDVREELTKVTHQVLNK